jgi:hypothetical protein
MAANTNPIFTLTPKMGWLKFRTGSPTTGYIISGSSATATDGSASTATLIATMGSDGGFVTRITAKAMGTNAVAVLRVFVNNGSTKATIANNSMIAELSLPATTQSASTWTTVLELPLMRQMPAGYMIYVDISGSSLTEGWAVTCEWGDY